MPFFCIEKNTKLRLCFACAYKAILKRDELPKSKWQESRKTITKCGKFVKR